MTEAQIYFWLMLDNISGFFVAAMIIYGLIMLFATLVILIQVNEGCMDKKHLILLRLWIIFPIFTAGAVFTPTSQQYAVIKILPKIANSEFVTKEVPADMKDMYGMAKEYLKEKLEVKK